MALLQPDKAIYHHPLDTKTETIKSEVWTQSGGNFEAGKVSNAIVGKTGNSLSAFGTETEFLSAGAAFDISVAVLSSTLFVVAYRDNADADHGTAKVGTVSGKNITFGVEAEFFSTGLASAIFVAKLNATSVVIAYNAGTGRAKIGTVSGTSISFGAETGFFVLIGNITLAVLSPTVFVVSYRDFSDGSIGKSRVGTVSGTSITLGAETAFLSGAAVFPFSAALSATTLVVAYRDAAAGARGAAKIGTVSGTDITFGAAVEFVSVVASVGLSVAALSSTSIVLSYRHGVSGRGTANIGTVSGTSITFGAAAEFTTSDFTSSVIAVTCCSATSFVVAYPDAADSNHGTAKIGTVSGTDIVFGTEEEFLSTGAAAIPSAAALSTTSFVVAYQDDSDSDHGTAKIGTLPIDASLTGTSALYDSVIGSTKLAYTGWMKEPSA